MVTEVDVLEEDAAEGEKQRGDAGNEPPSYWAESGRGKEQVGLLWRAGQDVPFVRLLFQPNGEHRLFSR
jgi:hypothetical protein